MGKVTTKEVISELRKIKRKLSRTYALNKMILFGSRAKGTELLNSDVDLLVVSEKFTGMPFRKRPDKFLDAWKLPVDLEVLCYSPDELKRKKKEIGLVRDALKTGKFI